MKLQKIALMIGLCAILGIKCCEQKNQIITRQATLNDFDAISAISQQYYQNDFKQLWTHHYASMTPLNYTIEDFVNEKMNNATESNKTIILQQSRTSNQRLLIAEITQPNTLKKIAGYCRFEKKNPQTIYINFIAVDESLRKQGIAKQLAYAAMKSFDNITECRLRALIHYNFVNQLYTKLGCIKTGTISLDPHTETLNTQPNAIMTHNDYVYTITK